MAEITSHDGRLHVLAMDDVLDMRDGSELLARRAPLPIRNAVHPLADGSGLVFPTRDAQVLLTAAT